MIFASTAAAVTSAITIAGGGYELLIKKAPLFKGSPGVPMMFLPPGGGGVPGMWIPNMHLPFAKGVGAYCALTVVLALGAHHFERKGQHGASELLACGTLAEAYTAYVAMKVARGTVRGLPLAGGCITVGLWLLPLLKLAIGLGTE
jgi:hypothetical protein